MTLSPTCSAGVRCRKPFGRAGRPSSCPRRVRWSAARSETAEIVNEGLTPSAVGRRREERAVMGVLDHRQQLDAVVPVRDRVLLLEAPPGGLALRRPPVVVEEVGEAR